MTMGSVAQTQTEWAQTVLKMAQNGLKLWLIQLCLLPSYPCVGVPKEQRLFTLPNEGQMFSL